jgi:hypothetical protein
LKEQPLKKQFCGPRGKKPQELPQNQPGFCKKLSCELRVRRKEKTPVRIWYNGISNTHYTGNGWGFFMDNDGITRIFRDVDDFCAKFDRYCKTHLLPANTGGARFL